MASNFGHSLRITIVQEPNQSFRLLIVNIDKRLKESMVASAEHPTEIILNMINVIELSVSRREATSVQHMRNNDDPESNMFRYLTDCIFHCLAREHVIALVSKSNSVNL